MCTYKIHVEVVNCILFSVTLVTVRMTVRMTGEDENDNDDYDSNITAKWADLCDGEQLPR